MPAAAPRRRWTRIAIVALVVLVPFALALGFATANRPQPILLDLGLWTWRGEAVHAVFAGAVVGLLVMFLVGLPSDLRARAERERLSGRVRALERELETERRAKQSTPPEP